MNYIWDHAIKALQRGIDQDDIVYKCGEPFSPYMELSFIDINETNPQLEVEINPYYRYYSVFKELLEPNFVNAENDKAGIADSVGNTIDTLLDINVHHLKDIDVLMGMCRREYYIRFVIKDMHNGHFGAYIQKNIGALTREEQKIVANNLLSLFETGECIHLLKDTIRRIFTNAYVFSNAEEKDEIVFYLRTEETDEKWAKIEVIKHLFLPFKCNILIYWEQIFGLIGTPEMMKMGETMNY